jgi:hypothetical protein
MTNSGIYAGEQRKRPFLLRVRRPKGGGRGGESYLCLPFPRLKPGVSQQELHITFRIN